MKRLFAILAATAAISLLFSCTKEQDQKEENDNHEQVVINPSDEGGFTLTLSMPETKTTFDGSDSEGFIKKWSKGDQICVNGYTSDALTQEQAGGTTASFHFSSEIVGPYTVVYPASAYSLSGITIPATQTFVPGSFDPASDIILGYGETADNITLNNAVAYIKIRLTQGQYGNFGVKNIKITASGKKLNGTFAIANHNELTDPNPSSPATEEEQTITLDASAIKPLLSTSETEFLIAVAPQTLGSGFSVTVEDTKGNTMTKTKSSSTTLNAGKILAQPAFAFDEFKAIRNADELIEFAANCAGDDGWYKVVDNIDLNDATDNTWPQAGSGDAEATAFKGGFDGGNNGSETGGFKISNLHSTTGAFINYLWSTGTVRNLTLDNTCSIAYSDAVSSNLYMGSVVGLSRGNVSYCFNRASVSWTSTSYSATVYMGGIIGRQAETGSISHCYNYGNVTSTALGGDTNIYMGGIVGSLERTTSAASAEISYCENQGLVQRGDITNTAEGNLSAASITHVGGVIGMLYIKPASSKLTITNLAHSSKNVSGPEQGQNNGHAGKLKPVLVGGIIGGIHGDDIASTAGSVEVKNSTVSNCNIYNGHWNNNTPDNSSSDAGYGTSDHVGGLVGVARGANESETIIFTECIVNNVDVSSRRGMAGGLASWCRGTKIYKCKVLNSSVRASANAIFAGGIAACAFDANISNCDVTLTKNNTYSLRTRGSYFYTGGIVGWVRGSSTISNCKAYVKLMTQSGATDKEGYRGWIAGYCNGTSTTIENCGLGGTYGETSPTIILDGTNYTSYIYGSSSTNVTLGTDENACYYWDGTL